MWLDGGTILAFINMEKLSTNNAVWVLDPLIACISGVHLKASESKDPKSLLRPFKKANLGNVEDVTNLDLILWPINIKWSHWILLYVRPGHEEAKVRVMDSKGGDKVRDQLLATRFVNALRGSSLLPNGFVCDNWLAKEDDVIHPVPQQNNDDDCGVCVSRNASLLIKEQPVDRNAYDGAEMNEEYRLTMLRVLQTEDGLDCNASKFPTVELFELTTVLEDETPTETSPVNLDQLLQLGASRAPTDDTYYSAANVRAMVVDLIRHAHHATDIASFATEMGTEKKCAAPSVATPPAIICEDPHREAYCQDMAKHDTYGGHVELVGLSQLLRSPLVIVQHGYKHSNWFHVTNIVGENEPGPYQFLVRTHCTSEKSCHYSYAIPICNSEQHQLQLEAAMYMVDVQPVEVTTHPKLEDGCFKLLSSLGKQAVGKDRGSLRLAIFGVKGDGACLFSSAAMLLESKNPERQRGGVKFPDFMVRHLTLSPDASQSSRTWQGKVRKTIGSQGLLGATFDPGHCYDESTVGQCLKLNILRDAMGVGLNKNSVLADFGAGLGFTLYHSYCPPILNAPCYEHRAIGVEKDPQTHQLLVAAHAKLVKEQWWEGRVATRAIAALDLGSLEGVTNVQLYDGHKPSARDACDDAAHGDLMLLIFTTPSINEVTTTRGDLSTLRIYAITRPKLSEALANFHCIHLRNMQSSSNNIRPTMYVRHAPSRNAFCHWTPGDSVCGELINAACSAKTLRLLGMTDDKTTKESQDVTMEFDGLKYQVSLHVTLSCKLTGSVFKHGDAVVAHPQHGHYVGVVDINDEVRAVITAASVYSHHSAGSLVHTGEPSLSETKIFHGHPNTPKTPTLGNPTRRSARQAQAQAHQGTGNVDKEEVTVRDSRPTSALKLKRLNSAAKTEQKEKIKVLKQCSQMSTRLEREKEKTKTLQETARKAKTEQSKAVKSAKSLRKEIKLLRGASDDSDSGTRGHGLLGESRDLKQKLVEAEKLLQDRDEQDLKVAKEKYYTSAKKLEEIAKTMEDVIATQAKERIEAQRQREQDQRGAEKQRVELKRQSEAQRADDKKRLKRANKENQAKRDEDLKRDKKRYAKSKKEHIANMKASQEDTMTQMMRENKLANKINRQKMKAALSGKDTLRAQVEQMNHQTRTDLRADLQAAIQGSNGSRTSLLFAPLDTHQSMEKKNDLMKKKKKKKLEKKKKKKESQKADKQQEKEEEEEKKKKKEKENVDHRPPPNGASSPKKTASKERTYDNWLPEDIANWLTSSTVLLADANACLIHNQVQTGQMLAVLKDDEVKKMFGDAPIADFRTNAFIRMLGKWKRKLEKSELE